MTYSLKDEIIEYIKNNLPLKRDVAYALGVTDNALIYQFNTRSSRLSEWGVLQAIEEHVCDAPADTWPSGLQAIALQEARIITKQDFIEAKK